MNIRTLPQPAPSMQADHHAALLRHIMNRSDERPFLRQLMEDGMTAFRRAQVVDHTTDADYPTWQCPDCSQSVEFDVFGCDIEDEFHDLVKIAKHLDRHRKRAEEKTEPGFSDENPIHELFKAIQGGGFPR